MLVIFIAGRKTVTGKYVCEVYFTFTVAFMAASQISLAAESGSDGLRLPITYIRKPLHLKEDLHHVDKTAACVLRMAEVFSFLLIQVNQVIFSRCNVLSNYFLSAVIQLLLEETPPDTTATPPSAPTVDGGLCHSAQTG